MPLPQILIIEDESDLAQLYQMGLGSQYAYTWVDTVAKARNALQGKRFDLILCDMRLPDGTGMELMQSLDYTPNWVMLTAFGSPTQAVEALKLGAFDYLTKPVELAQLRQCIVSALEAGAAKTAVPSASKAHAADAQSLRQHEGVPTEEQLAASVTTQTTSKASKSPPIGVTHTALQSLVGTAPGMQAVRNRVAQVAATMAPVMVRGESGTGKELVARALHAASPRHSAAFVAVNCAAIPENLLEAEFFGARRGAYTGLTQDREGYFEAAHGGTLFLDEIGDLPLAMQAKLLRVIQERRVRRLGETQETTTDVRLVCATHRPLAEMAQSGQFRQDLFYRLNVIEIALPALRERMEDLPELCSAILDRLVAANGFESISLSSQTLDLLKTQHWPGNIRELENALYRALAMGQTNSAGELELPEFAADVGPAGKETPHQNATPTAQDAALSFPLNLETHLQNEERRVIQNALQHTQGNRTAAAALLGMNLRQIRYRLELLGIDASVSSPG